MADYSISQSTDFEIQTITLTTDYGVYDISGMFREINIFDSILQPCMSGNIILEDSVGLANKLSFQGAEFISINISKTEDFLALNKAFHVYKMSNRRISGNSSETYVLHFVSDEFTFSEQKRVEQYYEDSYSEVVKSIFKDHLLVDETNFVVEDTYGIKRPIPTKLKPLDAISWCAKRALDSNYLPNFLFFENVDGYNFVSLSTLMSNAPMVTIRNSVKNIGGDQTSDEFLSARNLEVVSQFDYIRNTRSGLYAGTFIGFDTMTRQFTFNKIDLDKIYGSSTKANPNRNKSNYVNREAVINTQMFDSKISVFPTGSFRSRNPWLMYKDPQMALSEEEPEKWLYQRKAILQNLTSKRVKVVLAGNFGLTSGYNINMLIPIRGQKTDDDSDENMDLTLMGKHLIIATRHIIRYDKHETIIEVATDSTYQESLAEDTTVGETEYAQDTNQSAE